ncbi:putative E3 ubiquitin-protein ligase [Wickerhamomyces ciferrii]|uniref:E3 ubiquitin-protein ligase n=1 Tax=Wickerhamomyces ciferrii (strain ATCC 14091 / BCRC 22168 / CBS 111 / JCM 3599 / NBRC 0793 / NRRL Y-1031 F-60-10) TaxID=1206466 RepID=K0KDE8_WICCF|nr:putative E3 ubiquitin-protein ligase [Wickerhamomyces ciferrii]CCH40936.1 putative E3 ubiquitin-protein ligase [Wickerhamomyces ciferrii]
MSQDTQSSITAQEYISSQNALEKQARELMPYDPNTCTYSMGSIRQQIYACLTCLEKTNQLSGVCYSCSIQCHHDHNLIELFTKRNFNCDCGTTRTQFPCSLRSNSKDDLPSNDNIYNQNYKGIFCDCSKPYNPLEEKSNMLQCIFGDQCNEDWYHDYCIMGLDHYDVDDTNHDDNDKSVNKLDSLGEPEQDAQTQLEKNLQNNDSIGDKRKQDDNPDDQDSEPVLNGFPNLDDFDCFICWKCINHHKPIFDKIKLNNEIVLTTVDKITSKSLIERNEIIKSNTNSLLHKKRKIDYDYSIFLKHNHEENFTYLYNTTTDQEIKSFLQTHPHLLKDEPIYEPPQDESDDDNSSIYDLGARAINNLPRDKAIEGVQAYQNIKDKLKEFLKPFAKDGKIVGEEDVKGFFENIKK